MIPSRGEGIGFDAGIEKPDIEGARLAVTRLRDELIEPS